MNRERLLFVAVQAILALWFVLREAPSPIREAQAKTIEVEPRKVLGTSLDLSRLTLPKPQRDALTVQTNEQDHPRPPVPTPEARQLINVWPPTSRTVRDVFYGRLRHPVAAPVEETEPIELPDLQAAAAAGGVAPTVERLDRWTSFNQPGQGTKLMLW